MFEYYSSKSICLVFPSKSMIARNRNLKYENIHTRNSLMISRKPTHEQSHWSQWQEPRLWFPSPHGFSGLFWFCNPQLQTPKETDSRTMTFDKWILDLRITCRVHLWESVYWLNFISNLQINIPSTFATIDVSYNSGEDWVGWYAHAQLRSIIATLCFLCPMLTIEQCPFCGLSLISALYSEWSLAQRWKYV